MLLRCTQATCSKQIVLSDRLSSIRTAHVSLCLQVTVPTEETASEEILAAAAGQEATVCMELWRADMLLGVAEVVEGCSITRVEPSVGLLLGTAHTALFQTNLEQ